MHFDTWFSKEVFSSYRRRHGCVSLRGGIGPLDLVLSLFELFERSIFVLWKISLQGIRYVVLFNASASNKMSYRAVLERY